MNQSHQFILSTCYVKIEQGSENTLIYFIPQDNNNNGVDYIISYKFALTEFLKKFKLPQFQTNDGKYVFQGFKLGIVLKKINLISAKTYLFIYQQLLQIILICHQNQILARCLTIENIYINLENYQIYLLEFGFLPRLPSFINQCDIKTDIVVIQQIMKFLDTKVKEQTQETRYIQQLLAQQNLDYYNLFDLKILDEALQNQGREFYGYQFQNEKLEIIEKINLYDDIPFKTFNDDPTYKIDYKNSIQILLNYFIITVQSIQNDVKFKQIIIFIIAKILKQLQQDLQQNNDPQFFIQDIDWPQWITEPYQLTKIQNKILETLALLRRVEQDINCDLKSLKIDYIDQSKSETQIYDQRSTIKQAINNSEERLRLSILFCLKLYNYQYQQIQTNFKQDLNCKKGIQSILNEIKYGQRVNKMREILKM